MFKQIIIDNQDKINNLQIINRDYAFQKELLKLNKIVSFVWPRRVGKTFLMLQFVQDLIKDQDVKKSQIIFLNFAIRKWEKINPQDLLDSYFEINLSDEPFLVLDEIQDITNFIEFVLFFYDKWYKIFISGNNSSLLSSELSTVFGGRVFQYNILPLTFREVLWFANINIKKNRTSQEKWELKNILKNCIYYWTFPEIVLTKDVFLKETILRDYLDIIVYKDILERYKIDNEIALRFFVKRILAWNTKNLSINKIFNDLKSSWIVVWNNSLYNYFGYLENIFFCKSISNLYNPKWQKKSYVYNLWYCKLFDPKKEYSSWFENFVLLHLLKQNHEIKYKSDKQEVDFHLSDNTDIQVCRELHDDNFARETYFGEGETTNQKLIFVENNTKLEIPKGIIVQDYLNFFLW